MIQLSRTARYGPKCHDLYGKRLGARGLACAYRGFSSAAQRTDWTPRGAGLCETANIPVTLHSSITEGPTSPCIYTRQVRTACHISELSKLRVSGKIGPSTLVSTLPAHPLYTRRAARALLGRK